MGKAPVYTYMLLPRISRYVLDGRYHIDNNRVRNVIRPLVIDKKKFLFSSYKTHGIGTRTCLEDTLKGLPTEKDIDSILPQNSSDYLANLK